MKLTQFLSESSHEKWWYSSFSCIFHITHLIFQNLIVPHVLSNISSTWSRSCDPLSSKLTCSSYYHFYLSLSTYFFTFTKESASLFLVKIESGEDFSTGLYRTTKHTLHPITLLYNYPVNYSLRVVTKRLLSSYDSHLYTKPSVNVHPLLLHLTNGSLLLISLFMTLDMKPVTTDRTSLSLLFLFPSFTSFSSLLQSLLPPETALRCVLLSLSRKVFTLIIPDRTV